MFSTDLLATDILDKDTITPVFLTTDIKKEET